MKRYKRYLIVYSDQDLNSIKDKDIKPVSNKDFFFDIEEWVAFMDRHVRENQTIFIEEEG